MQVQLLELSAVPNLGDLLGSQSSATLTSYINSFENKSQFFGSSFDKLQDFRQQFIDQLVTPVKQAGVKVINFIEQLVEEKPIQAVQSVEDLENVHPAMYLPILTYGPVYRLHKQGRIEGYGIDPHHVKLVKPTYDRLIRENGFVDLSVPSKFGTKFIYHEYHSTDPVMTTDMLDAIWDTEDFIDGILEHTELDPTNPNATRG